MGEVLEQGLGFDLLHEEGGELLGALLDFGFVAGQAVEHAVADHAQVVLG